LTEDFSEHPMVPFLQRMPPRVFFFFALSHMLKKKNEEREMKEFEKALSYLPSRLRLPLEKYSRKEEVCEIRLRKNLPLSLTTFSGNIVLDENGRECAITDSLRAEEAELQEAVTRFCEGSVYRYLDTLGEGFLINSYGIRMGICPEKREALGKMLPESYSGINLRIPRNVPGAAKNLVSFYRESGICSTLIVSPPGAGKTTLLRDLADSLSRGALLHPLRTAVIDERKEIFPLGYSREGGLCDVLSGYSKGKGIEIATRVFAPEVILCDEIGSREDAESILAAQSSGVILIATAHGASLESIERKPHLAALIKSGIFHTLAVLEKEESRIYRSRLLFCRIA